MQKLGYGERIPRGPEPVLFRYSQETGPRSIYEIFVEPIWQSPAYSRGQVFRDKIVFVAPEGNTQKDLIPTPLGDLAGPEVHMSLLNAALKDEFLHEPGPWADLLTILCAGALAVLVCIAVQNPVQRILSLILAAVGFGTAALLLFNTLGWFPILLSPVLALASTGTVWSAWEQAFEIRDKARIRRTLEGYVSRDVVREVLDNPESFLNTQGGARRCITVLFSDVRGFTTMTESADAERLVAQLKEYFTEMVRIVFSRDGTLDKFIGDAVMAHWGSITSHGREADACQAVGAALEMFQALERLNADWKARGMMEFKVGLGINHGEAIVGRIGSEDKHEFSAIGDPINLASRLEGATKQFHQQILLGESVAPMVREQFVIRTVGLIQVKGKTKPVDVFTALSERNDAGEPPWLARYEDGVKLYRRRAFAEAAECFHKAAALNPEDWLIGEYQRWCADYLAAPPGPDWDGVYVMTDK
jgi:adenylate cyclase